MWMKTDGDEISSCADESSGTWTSTTDRYPVTLKMTMISMPEQLKKILAERPRDLVIVVGAGVSIGALRGSALAKLASWQGLIQDGLDHVESRGGPGREDLGRIRGLLDSQDAALWIEAAEWLTRMLGGADGGAFRGWLRATAGAFAAERRELEVLTTLAAMAERGALLATTNYDGLLEAVTGAPAVTWREPSRVARVIRGDEPGILHLHGYWAEPASVVLGRHSYDEVVRDEHAQATLRALRMTKTFVFVGAGAGLEDPNMGSFLRWTAQVFAGCEYEHYRLVREEEREAVQAIHPEEQRIRALSYGRAHDELAPFLRSLLPAPQPGSAGVTGAAAGPLSVPAVPATKTIVLLVNIGEKDHYWLTREAAAAQVEDPDAEWLEVAEIVPRRAITSRQWRALARQLDEKVDAAGRVTTGRARFIVMGQAPLPVFVYLGRKMSRLGPITVINRRQENGIWDRVGPLEAIPGDGRDDFTVEPPRLGRERSGTVVLSVQCSREYSYNEGMVEPMIESQGGRLLCSYQIHNEKHFHRDVAMTAAELPVLLSHVDSAVAMLGRECPGADGLVLCLGGPTWVGFWVGYRLSQNAFGGRIDMPNFIPGAGYQRSLAAPMHLAPWLAGKAKLLVVAAEPDDLGRTRASKGADTIRAGLERELGRDGPYEARVLGAAEFGEIMREIELFAPDILHLHLHGSKDGDLAFEDARGETQRIPGETFVRMLRIMKVKPTLIVLSACHSAVLASALAELAECVIAMTDTVAYKTALSFAQYFYGALGRGNSVAEAIEKGKLGASITTTGHENIQLTTASGVAAEDIILFSARAQFKK